MSIPVLVRDFNLSGNGLSRVLDSIGNNLFLSVDDGINGYELWVYDVTGSVNDAHMVKNINPTGNSNPTEPIVFNNILYFSAGDGVNGIELWRSDGTEAGTYMVKDIRVGNGNESSNISNFCVFNNTLYFIARGTPSYYQIWKTDGTEAGTEVVTDINNTASNQVLNMMVFNNMLYLGLNDGVNGAELWRSDGTQAGTELVKDINIGSASSVAFMLCVYNNNLYFRATDSVNGRELWKTDGTSEGTVLVKDINSGTSTSNIGDIVVYNGFLYFRANDGVTGTELWRSDGTTEGTVFFKEIYPGTESSVINHLFVAGNTLLFTAKDGVNGYELWRSDGTPENTVIVSNINPATDNSYYWSYTYMKTIDNNTVYFVADDGVNGKELWKYDVAETTGSPEPEPVVPLDASVINEIENAVPTISDTSVPVIVVDVPVGVLTVGTESVKSQKRTAFLAKLFTDTVGLDSASGKITMTRDNLLGASSVITKNTMVIKKASNTDVVQDTSQLASDEAMYVFMSSGDFTVFNTSGGNLKIIKTSETQYDIYENYVDSNSPVTKAMSVGATSSLGTFTYVVGGVSGQINSSSSVAPICFPAGTPVTTNQGQVAIEKLNPDIHTIRNKRIVAITQTRPLFTHIVSIEKDALGKNVPSVTTQISKEHGVFYKGKMTRAVDLVGVCDGVVEIPYNGETLYNVLLKKHSHMMINNLICETLHPENIMAKICGGKYNSSEQNKIYEELTSIIKANNIPAYKKLYASLK